MRREYMPFYASRLVISGVFAWVVFGLTWAAPVAAAVLFGMFLLYFHSGWFAMDLTHPFFPLRRDDHGCAIQRRALLAGVMVGILSHIVITGSGVSVATAGSPALSLGIMTYFVTQIVMFIRR